MTKPNEDAPPACTVTTYCYDVQGRVTTIIEGGISRPVNFESTVHRIWDAESGRYLEIADPDEAIEPEQPE